MVTLEIRMELALATPADNSDLVVWFDVGIVNTSGGKPATVGSARAALIRVSESVDRGITLSEALEAQSHELSALHDIFFEDNDSLSEALTDHTNLNVLYVASVDLLLPWRGRKVEEALVCRIAEVLGEGCAIIAVPFVDKLEATRWREVGFAIAREPRDGFGYAYLDLAIPHPQITVIDTEDTRFAVSPREEQNTN